MSTDNVTATADMSKALSAVKTLDEPTREHIDPSEVDTSAEVELVEMPDGYLEPWGRQSNETDRNWEVYKFYRDLGPGRKLKQVSDEFGYKSP